MNRRDLLKYLLATPLAATFDYERLLWVPGQMVTVPGMPDVGPVTLEWMTTEALALLKRAVRRSFEPAVEARVGDGMVRQLWVTLSADDVCHLSRVQCRERYLSPAVYSIAHKVRKFNPTRFGKLSAKIPGASAVSLADTQTGIALLGVEQYNILRDQMQWGFVATIDA